MSAHAASSDSHADRWLRGEHDALDVPAAVRARSGEAALAIAEDQHRVVHHRLVQYASGKLVVLSGDEAAAAIATGVPHRPLAIGATWCDRTQRGRPLIARDEVVTTASEAVRLRGNPRRSP